MQLGLASGLSPVTIAFFPTLARGAANPTTTGLDRSAGFFFGVGLFLRGGVRPSLRLWEMHRTDAGRRSAEPVHTLKRYPFLVADACTNAQLAHPHGGDVS